MTDQPAPTAAPVDHGPDRSTGVFIRMVGWAFRCKCGKADFVAGYPCSAMKPGDTFEGQVLNDP